MRIAVRKIRQLEPFHIDAWVVLPDHLHCIWTMPADDDDYSNRRRLIKKTFSKSISKVEYRSVARLKRHERGIWQRRFWEHTVTNAADYAAHMDYIHYNPVKHQWVSAVKEWPYSTFYSMVSKGIYPQDWAGCETRTLDAGERR